MASILHLRTQGFLREHLVELLRQARADGFEAVNIHWERFPHSFEPEPAHSPEDVRAVDAACEEFELEVIPTSHSFTHSGDLMRLPAFKHLKDGGDSLELTDNRTLEIMTLIAKELKAAHPLARTVHMGGDEIFRYATNPASNRYIVDHGRSALYVDFVNRLAAELRKLDLRLAIWSDMLIRYPEKATAIDRSILMFYWDYWSGGERSPFATIGGGMNDLFILDRAAITGDLKMLLFSHMAREGREIPLGHWREFARYWQVDPQEKSVRSFSYCEWFRDLGLDHVASLLTIPEKGSFLPPVAQKLDHIRGFIRRSKAAGGVGWMACSWGDYWPPIAMFRPGFLVAQAIAAHPDADDAAVYAAAARRLGAPWTQAALQGWCEAGAHVEFADMLDPNWGATPIAHRLDWLAKANLLEDDLARAKAAAGRCEALLAGPMVDFPAEGWERFALEDMAWRCRLETACHSRDCEQLQKLTAQGHALRQWATRIFAQWWPAAAVEARVAKRYDQWEEAASAAMASP